MNNICEGIVLSMRDFKDNDVILTVLTKEEGTLSFVAKGIKKAKSKNASACELFTYSRFYYNHNERSDLQSLKTAERIQVYRHIYEDLQKQVIASLLCEVCTKISIDDSFYVFDLLQNCLRYLNEDSNDYCVLGFFMAQLNEVVGVTPNVDGCVHCSNPQVMAISIRNGGFVCSDCYQNEMDERTSIERLRYFRLFHKAGLSDFAILAQIKRFTYDDIRPILLIFLEYSGIALKTMNLLREIIGFDCKDN